MTSSLTWAKRSISSHAASWFFKKLMFWLVYKVVFFIMTVSHVCFISFGHTHYSITLLWPLSLSLAPLFLSNNLSWLSHHMYVCACMYNMHFRLCHLTKVVISVGTRIWVDGNTGEEGAWGSGHPGSKQCWSNPCKGWGTLEERVRSNRQNATVTVSTALWLCSFAALWKWKRRAGFRVTARRLCLCTRKAVCYFRL